MSTGSMFNLCTLVVFFTSYIVSVHAGETPSLPDFATLCPYNDFCTSKAKSWLAPTSGMKSSCQRCSCAMDCHLVGNCCPDKPNMTVTDPIYACTNLETILNYPRQIYTLSDDASYRVIDSCPDVDMSNKFPFCENPAKLEDYVIVSNVENEKIYKNRHCAMCHGVNDVIEWELVLTFDNVMKNAFQSVEDRDAYVLKMSALKARPPNREIVEMAGCYYDYMVIRGCAQFNNNLSAYDIIELKKACYENRPNQNTIFKDGSTKRTALYTNIYCYLCNNHNQTEVPTLHETPENDLDMTIPFSSVIKKFNGDEQMSNGVCNQTQVWDNITNVCRSLHCPAGTTAVKGQCEDSVVYSEGYPLYALFKLEVLFGEMELNYLLTTKVSSYLHGFIDSIYECGICTEELIQANGTLYFRSTYFTTKRCAISTLLEMVRSIVAKTENITLVCGEELGLRLVFVKEKTALNIDKGVNILGTVSCLASPSQIDHTMLYDCPKFLIPSRELVNISSDNNVHLDQPDVVSICVEKYFQMFQMQQSGAVSLNLHEIFYRIVILLYVPALFVP